MNLTQIPNWIKKLVKIFNFVHKSTKRKWNISKFYKNAVAVELSVLLMSYGRPFQWIVAQSLENSFFFAVPNWTWGKQIFQCNPFKINIHLFHAIFIFDVFLLNIYILATMLIKSCENVQKWVEINFRIVLDMNFVKNSETEAFPIRLNRELNFRQNKIINFPLLPGSGFLPTRIHTKITDLQDTDYHIIYY